MAEEDIDNHRLARETAFLRQRVAELESTLRDVKSALSETETRLKERDLSPVDANTDKASQPMPDKDMVPQLPLTEYPKRLQSLASELTRSEDHERRQIALYLHDQVGQSLAAVRVKFAAWKGMTPSPKRDDMLADIEQLIDQTIDDTRSLTFELSPPILYELGLGPALEWLGEHLCDKEAIDFEYSDDGRSRKIEEIMASALYRIVRELLLNVMKHAQASHVSVSVSADDIDIRLVVKDNGIGMEYSHYEQALKGLSGTYGLFSIRERLHDLYGSVNIESKPGEGTCITVTAPVHSPVSTNNGGIT